MTRSEELVYKLCTKSFLSMWSYPNPKGKKGKELCDILIVCEPDIIIISVKEIEFKDTGDKDTGDKVGLERWHKKAVYESYNQIYGAERWINSNSHVISHDGEIGLPFPDKSIRKIHRIAVALGSNGKASIFFGDLGKGFVHVLDEISLEVIMAELDTITDFVTYLNDKETYYRKGNQTLFTGEENLLAFYLSQERKFPNEATFIALDDDLWRGFKNNPQVSARKKLNEISYIWDEVIEEMHPKFLDYSLIKEIPHSANELSDIEKAVRTMAREDRYSRRMLSISLADFIQKSRIHNVKSRISESNFQDVVYVFLSSNYDLVRKANLAELAGRCLVARGLTKSKKIVVGIGIEFSEIIKGSSTTLCYFDVPEWNEEWQRQMDYLQKEFGYFVKPQASGFHENEYPDFE